MTDQHTKATIRQIVPARPTSDGDGVNIKRLSGFLPGLKMDPFLMLDEINSDDKDDFVGGFPPHPHRGFETVTYMRNGGFSHTDSMGNTGSIAAGGAQWMSAASGVIHSEMPVADANAIHGFQFWLNLPAAEKMSDPNYRDIALEEMSSLERQGKRLKLIAGSLTFDGEKVDGAVRGKTTEAVIADIAIDAGHTASLWMSEHHQLQFYVYAGTVQVGETRVETGQLAYLESGDSVEITGIEQAELLFFGGLPLNEPVAHYGPFVMNTQQEIDQAIRDYQNGTLVQ